MRQDDVPSFFDVRMRGFRDRAEVTNVVALLAARLQALPAEGIDVRDAAGRWQTRFGEVARGSRSCQRPMATEQVGAVRFAAAVAS